MINQIRIQKRSLPEWSALLLVILPLFYSFLTELLGLPRAVRFVSDFLIVASMAIILSRSYLHGKLLVPRISSAISVVVSIFIIYTLIGYVLNYQSFLYYIWGARNNFRFYFAFLIFVAFFDEDGAEKCLNIIDGMFWIHSVVTVIQYFMGNEQDFLGGIFGTEKGCNGYTIVFISIVTIRSLLSYMNGSESALLCFSKCAVALLVAALAELKIFFLLFILILIMAAAITRFSFKKFLLMLISVLLVSVAYLILVTQYEHFRDFFSFENLLNELLKENYASSEDLGRFTSIPTISRRFLTTLPDRLFGMGLGNCDTSTISIFNTAFYDKYVDIHYSIFSVSFLYLETGFIGLTVFTMFFVVSLIQSINKLRQEQGNLLFNQMGIIMSVMCFILIFYNSSLRTEAGYLVYFVLALPYIGTNNNVYVRFGD